MLLIPTTTYPLALYCRTRFVGTWTSALLQLMSLLVNPQETLQVLLMMSQLLVGQTVVTPPRAPGVHTEGTVEGSDLENKTLVFRRRFLKQNQGRSIQGSFDRERLIGLIRDFDKIFSEEYGFLRI